jgi:hypothetical protein
MRQLLFLLLLLSSPAQAQQPAHRAKHHTTARPAISKAYYCASGNTVKYHASATCRGLNRCSATVKPLALSEAQAQMEPCKICH